MRGDLRWAHAVERRGEAARLDAAVGEGVGDAERPAPGRQLALRLYSPRLDGIDVEPLLEVAGDEPSSGKHARPAPQRDV